MAKMKMKFFLTVESNGALTAEEIIIAAIEQLNKSIKDFGETINALQIPNNL